MSTCIQEWELRNPQRQYKNMWLIIFVTYYNLYETCLYEDKDKRQHQKQEDGKDTAWARRWVKKVDFPYRITPLTDILCKNC